MVEADEGVGAVATISPAATGALKRESQLSRTWLETP
jgi:hypothetical protein